MSLLFLVFIFGIVYFLPYFWHCPKGMVFVPAGNFNMIWTSERYGGYKNETIETDHYCIDKYEYPNLIGEFPMRIVTWEDATKLCEENGKRLCTQYEWQKACQGPEGFIYPYGNIFEYKICNTHLDFNKPGNLSRIGSFPMCKSGYGVYGMSGGLSEWVLDRWDINSNDRVLKAGSYNPNYSNTQKLIDGKWVFKTISNSCDGIHHHDKKTKLHDDGFRCCSEPNKLKFNLKK